jgi:hypothetical protein
MVLPIHFTITPMLKGMGLVLYRSAWIREKSIFMISDDSVSHVQARQEFLRLDVKRIPDDLPLRDHERVHLEHLE